ncbi:MAG: M24 family metallopeptidase [Alphaproteobacteria bacterium]
MAGARAALREADLAALLIFAQESHYYLTGFDTAGFVFFQCAVLTADERPITLLTRRPDLEQARRTSVIEDVRIWYDEEAADPTRELHAILAEKGLAGSRLGIELNTFGLTGFNHERVRRRLDGWCALVDASNLVRALRVTKSPAELVYVRKAAGLADAALLAMLDATRPGAFEGAIAAAGASAILAGGGDPPPSGPVLGSGERALLVRSATGYRTLDATDQLTLEFAGSYRYYCACLMRTVAIGKESARQRAMYEATREALAAMGEAVRPGRPLGEIDDAHRRVFDAAGFASARLAACGYSLGATFKPSWMDVPPMIYSGNPAPALPGMVLFLHAILIDAAHALAMSLGHTVVVGESGCEVLSKLLPEYRVCV